MRRKAGAVFMIIQICLILTGCWDKAELSQYGYVQALSIDRNDEGKVELTTLFYRPSSGGDTSTPAPQQSKGFTIVTTAETVFEAVRDIPTKLGRKAKWDHIRAVIISEDIAKQESIGDVMDFLSRDQEPRANLYMLLAPGKASSYLSLKPYIENTIAQQLREMMEVTVKYAGKAVKVSMLDLAIQLQGETGAAVIPRLRTTSSGVPYIAGIDLLRHGKMIGILSAKDTKGLLILRDEFKSGIIEYPCEQKSGKMGQEALEVTSIHTKRTLTLNRDELTVRVKVEIEGSIGELHCTSLQSKKDEVKLGDAIKRQIEKDILSTIANLQKKRIDAIGVGNQLYRKNPSLWKRWKPDWDERFSQLTFKVDIILKDLNSGLDAPNPFGKS